MEAIKEMRAECIRHYVERRHTPDHADLIVPKDEPEVLRLCAQIQEEEERATQCSLIPHPIAGLSIIEVVEADEETTAN